MNATRFIVGPDQGHHLYLGDYKANPHVLPDSDGVCTG